MFIITLEPSNNHYKTSVQCININVPYACLLKCRKFQDDHTIFNTGKLVQNKMADVLVDFDNHLDDVQLDWTNPKINRALPNGRLQ